MARLTRLGARGLKHSDFVQSLTGRDILVGPNGAGKTQRLDALALALLGYHPNPEIPKKGVLTHLARPGAAELEVYLELTGHPGQPTRVERVFAPGKSRVAIDGVKLKTAAAAAEKLAALVGNQVPVLDAAAALYGTGQERRRWLLDNMVGRLELEGVPECEHPLEWLEGQRAAADKAAAEMRVRLRAAEDAHRAADGRVKYMVDGGAPVEKLRARRDELQRERNRAYEFYVKSRAADDLREQLKVEETLLKAVREEEEIARRALAAAGKPAEDLDAQLAEAVRDVLKCQGACAADARTRAELERCRSDLERVGEQVETYTAKLDELPKVHPLQLADQLAKHRARYALITGALTLLNTDRDDGWAAAFKAADFCDEAWDRVEQVRVGLHERYVREQTELSPKMVEVERELNAARLMASRRADLTDLLEEAQASREELKAAVEMLEVEFEGAGARATELALAREEEATLRVAERARDSYRDLEQTATEAVAERARIEKLVDQMRAAIAKAPKYSPEILAEELEIVDKQLAQLNENLEEAVAYASAREEVERAVAQRDAARAANEQALGLTRRLEAIERRALEQLEGELPELPGVGPIKIEFDGDQARLWAGDRRFASLSGGQRVGLLARLLAVMAQPPLCVLGVEAAELDPGSLAALLAELRDLDFDNVIVCRPDLPAAAAALEGWQVHYLEAKA